MTVDVQERLGVWVEAGLISPDQARAIDDLELRSSSEGERTVVLAAEAVGYLGAALALIAGALVLEQVWQDVAVAWRLIIPFGASVLAFGGGVWLRGRGARPPQRLWSALWACSTAALAFFAVVLGDEVLGIDADGPRLTVFASAVTSVYALALYALRRRSLQQLALAVSVVVLAESTAAIAEPTPDIFLFGIVLYLLGLAWFAASVGGWIRPATTGQVLGLVGMGWGAQLGSFEDVTTVALALGTGTAVAALAGGVLAHRTLLLGAGVIGVFVFVPQLVSHLFGDTVGAPLVLLSTGLLLVATAVVGLRGRSRRIEVTRR